MTSFEKARFKKISRKANYEKLKIHMMDGKYEFYFFLLPIALPIIAMEELKDWNYRRMKWDADKATKVLDKVLPKVVEYVNEDDAYYYCMSWGTYSLWHKAPLHLRRWADKYSYDLKKFLKDEYQNAEYSKSIDDDGYDVWVKFEKRG